MRRQKPAHIHVTYATFTDAIGSHLPMPSPAIGIAADAGSSTSSIPPAVHETPAPRAGSKDSCQMLCHAIEEVTYRPPIRDHRATGADTAA
jgi:hypothetical protein